MLRLSPVGSIYPITPALFQRGIVSPDYRRLALVFMSLNHQINQCADVTDSHNLTAELWHTRGRMLRSLSDDLKDPERCTSDPVITGMLILLLIDVCSATVPLHGFLSASALVTAR